jgi:hypothetical protein
VAKPLRLRKREGNCKDTNNPIKSKEFENSLQYKTNGKEKYIVRKCGGDDSQLLVLPSSKMRLTELWLEPLAKVTALCLVMSTGLAAINFAFNLASCGGVNGWLNKKKGDGNTYGQS